MNKEDLKKLMKAEKVEARQDGISWNGGQDYKIIIKHNGHRATFYFTDSIHNKVNGIELNLNDVYYALISDMSCIDCAEDADDFCEQLGYTDSVKAYKTGLKAYKACLNNAKKLKKLFTDEELEEIKTEFEDY